VIIILEKISPKTNIHDIRDFIMPVLKGHIFQKSGRIGYIKIEILKDRAKGQLDYYALVLVNSDLAAQRIIKRRNMRLLVGRRVKVRQFFVRSWRNDPRNKGEQEIEGMVDMRKGERRVNALEEVRVRAQQIEFTSDKVFNRKL